MWRELTACSALGRRVARAMQDANAAYCIALAQLMRSPGDKHSAFQRASAWAAAAANEEMRGFLAEAEAQALPADFDCTDHQGYLRWAFVLAFRCVFD